MATLLKTTPHSSEVSLLLIGALSLMKVTIKQNNNRFNNEYHNYNICLNVCTSMLPPTQATNRHVKNEVIK